MRQGRLGPGFDSYPTQIMTVSPLDGSAESVSPLSSNVNPGDTPPSTRLAEHSRFVQRVRRRYEHELACLPPGAPVKASMNTCLATLTAGGLPMPAALRVLRQLVMERLVVLDCEQGAPLSDVTRAVTELAELALDQACALAFADLDELYGAPTTEQGQRAQLWVIGMGKLGARELNVSSDIDLIYVYDADGETAGNAAGRNRISNHEYFAKAVKHIYNTVGETTEHGSVFRVDLALRPNGNSGPPAVSLSALEEYFLVQGREWERFAWLKSRVIAPLASVADRSASALRGPVLPFVFRKYLDYNVFESLRNLHRQIRDHAAKRAAGNPGRANDVKLSRGGIREIEFTVQLLQVVRGGQFPELRKRPTLQALQCVTKADLMPVATAESLARAYEFLRKVEHRIQYLDDQQTHLMPTRDDDLAWIAATLATPMSAPSCTSWTATARWWRTNSTSCSAAPAPVAAMARAATARPRTTMTCSRCCTACRRPLRPRWTSGAATRAYRPCAKTRGCAWCAWSNAPAPGSTRAASAKPPRCA